MNPQGGAAAVAEAAADIPVQPADPIAAVTHPDPYPYYAALASQGPMQRDEKLGLWIAASASDVTDVLTSGLCGVRPLSELVPKSLQGSTAGDLFGRWIRMQDGPAHRTGKAALRASLDALPGSTLAATCRHWARQLAHNLQVERTSRAVQDYMGLLPAHVIGSLLGLQPQELRPMAELTGELARGIFPGANAAQIERAKSAAAPLLERFTALRSGRHAPGPAILLAILEREVQRAGVTADGFVEAHSVGLVFQAYDATAGLIGNTLVALARHRPPMGDAGEIAVMLPEFVHEVARHDPSTHNTRRFVHRDGLVAGHELRQGESILVVLAAANRDPAANPEPHRFDPQRQNPVSYTFGLGPHACPAEVLALGIVQAGVAALLQAGIDPVRLASSFTYRQAQNVRIPVFDAA
jgi:cytochrome P450